MSNATTGIPLRPPGTREIGDEPQPTVVRTPWATRVGLIATVAVTALTLVWLVVLAQRGLDLADESYYVLWIRDPGSFPASTSLFGFFFHPLYALVGGDIFWLRVINGAVMWLVAVLMMHRLIYGLQRRPKLSEPGSQRRNTDAIGPAALGLAAFFSLSPFLLTPNYNSLGLLGLMVSVIGLTYVWQPPARVTLIGWPVLAVGLWLTAMAKPTTTVLMAAVIGGVILVLGPRKIWGMLLATGTAVALMLVTAVLVDGSITGLRDRFTAGAELTEVAKSGHGLETAYGLLKWALQLQGITVSWRVVLLMGLVGSLTAAGIVLAHRLPQRGSLYAAISVLLASTALVIFLSPFDGLSQNMFAMTPLVAAVIFAATTVQRSRIEAPEHSDTPGRFLLAMPLSETKRPVAAVLVLLTAPFASAFGSNNNVWAIMPRAAVFWVAAAAVIVAALSPRSVVRLAVIPLALATALCTAAILKSSETVPYGGWYGQSGSLLSRTEPVDVGSGSMLRMDTNSAMYFASLRAAAERSGFAPGTPLINLADLPGAALPLQATVPGQPWLNTSYGGSADTIRLVLAEVPCDVMAASWLLLPNDSAGVLSAQGGVDGLLRPSGIRFPQDYERAATVVRPDGSLQALWQPRGDLDICPAGQGT